jgi:hypothetical protein
MRRLALFWGLVAATGCQRDLNGPFCLGDNQCLTYLPPEGSCFECRTVPLQAQTGLVTLASGTWIDDEGGCYFFQVEFTPPPPNSPFRWADRLDCPTLLEADECPRYDDAMWCDGPWTKEQWKAEPFEGSDFWG